MRPHRRTEATSPGGPRNRPGDPRNRPEGPRNRPEGPRSRPEGSHAPANAPGCPELLLVCEAWSTSLADGRWRFSIESADGNPVLEAADEEPGDLNRLTLLAAVRGLEAIDGPAAVMLLSTNRYLIRSLAESLPRWRAHDFAWEHFGRVIDIQHADLWRRIDRALRIHRVEACLVSSRLVSPGRLPAAANATREPSPATPTDTAPVHSASETAHWSAEIASGRSDHDEQLRRVDGPHTQPHRRKLPQPARETNASPSPNTHATQADGLRRLLLGHPISRSHDTSLPNEDSLPNSPTTPDHIDPRGHATARDHAPPPARRRGQRRHRFTAADLVETG